MPKVGFTSYHWLPEGKLFRQQWDELPMPDGVIATVEDMAQVEQQPLLGYGAPLFKWSPWVTIEDAELEPILQDNDEQLEVLEAIENGTGEAHDDEFEGAHNHEDKGAHYNKDEGAHDDVDNKDEGGHDEFSVEDENGTERAMEEVEEYTVDEQPEAHESKHSSDSESDKHGDNDKQEHDLRVEHGDNTRTETQIR
jgi:hypothetical protein